MREGTRLGAAPRQSAVVSTASPQLTFPRPLGLTRYDPVAEARIRRQDSVVADLMGARRWNLGAS